MREMVKLINKKDLEEIIELNIKLHSFYENSRLAQIALLPNSCSAFFMRDEEIAQKLKNNYIDDFSFNLVFNSAKIKTKFISYNEVINIKKDIQLEKNFTSKDIAKHIEKIIDEYNKEQDYITFVWGDEE